MTALVEQLSAARFDLLLDEAVVGTPLLLRARRPDTLPRLLDRARTGPLMLDVGEAPGAVGSPLDALLAAGSALGADVDDLDHLIGSPALRHAVLVGYAEGDTAGWLTVAGVYASLRRRSGEAGPALVVVTGAVRPPTGCRFFDDGDLFGPAESALLARMRRLDGGLIAQAADAAAIEVARGDPLLLLMLLELGDAERFDPTGWVARRPAASAPAPLLWRGGEAPCSVWLARHDLPALRRRTWRGHLGVLLPWLEDVRAHFLARYATRLPVGARDRITGELLEPADYEWGHIVTALRRLSNAPVAPADAMRRVRNALAHGDPAPWDDCRRLEQDAQRLLAWR